MDSLNKMNDYLRPVYLKITNKEYVDCDNSEQIQEKVFYCIERLKNTLNDLNTENIPETRSTIKKYSLLEQSKELQSVSKKILRQDQLLRTAPLLAELEKKLSIFQESKIKSSEPWKTAGRSGEKDLTRLQSIVDWGCQIFNYYLFNRPGPQSTESVSNLSHQNALWKTADMENNLVGADKNFFVPLALGESELLHVILSSFHNYNKTMMQYELFMKESEKLINKIKTSESSEKVFFQLGDKTYPLYNLDGKQYQFFGTSDDIRRIAKDYNGYISSQWEFLCCSIIDETHSYYRNTMSPFLILSTPSESIIQAAPEDIYSMDTSSSTANEWNALNYRVQAIKFYVDDTCKKLKLFLEEQNNNQEIQSFLQSNEIILDYDTPHNKVLKTYPLIVEMGMKHHLASAMSGRQEDDVNEINKNLSNTKSFKVDPKDAAYLQELINEFFKNKKIIKEYNPLNVKEMILPQLCMVEKALNNKVLREKLKEILHCERPEDEIKKLQSLAKKFEVKITNYSFVANYDKIRGPGELFNPSGAINEINIHTRKAGGVKILGCIMQENLLNLIQTMPEFYAEPAKKWFELAEKEKLPLFYRSGYL